MYDAICVTELNATHDLFDHARGVTFWVLLALDNFVEELAANDQIKYKIVLGRMKVVGMQLDDVFMAQF